MLDFQRNAGLLVDGIVGDSTIVKLDGRSARRSRVARARRSPSATAASWRPAGSPARRVVVDPGHGGQDTGYVSLGRRSPRRTSRWPSACGSPSCCAPRAAACDSPANATRQCRCTCAPRPPTPPPPTTSCRCTATQTSAQEARGAACYYFQRSHYYSEHGRRLAGYIGGRLEQGRCTLHRWLGPQLRHLARNARHRLARGAALSQRPGRGAPERSGRITSRLWRSALRRGLADYLAQRPCRGPTPAASVESERR